MSRDRWESLVERSARRYIWSRECVERRRVGCVYVGCVPLAVCTLAVCRRLCVRWLCVRWLCAGVKEEARREYEKIKIKKTL